jgi:hypothetical protein
VWFPVSWFVFFVCSCVWFAVHIFCGCGLWVFVFGVCIVSVRLWLWSCDGACHFSLFSSMFGLGCDSPSCGLSCFCMFHLSGMNWRQAVRRDRLGSMKANEI